MCCGAFSFIVSYYQCREQERFKIWFGISEPSYQTTKECLCYVFNSVKMFNYAVKNKITLLHFHFLLVKGVFSVSVEGG